VSNTTGRKSERFDQANLTAASILADVARYGGPESLMVRWARAVIDRAARSGARSRGVNVFERKPPSRKIERRHSIQRGLRAPFDRLGEAA
jgi:hypothetical protein